MPSFSQIISEMEILAHFSLWKQASKQTTKQASKQERMKERKLSGLFMPNFSQIHSEITVLAQLAKWTNQPTNQPLPIVEIALAHHFCKSGAIWNIHAKY